MVCGWESGAEGSFWWPQEQAVWRPIALQSNVSGTVRKVSGQESLHRIEDTLTETPPGPSMGWWATGRNPKV